MDWKYLVHITKNLPSNIFATGLLVIKNTGGSCLNEYHQHAGRYEWNRVLTRMSFPNERAGSSKLTQDSIWVTCTLNRGDITPVLFNRPLS